MISFNVVKEKHGWAVTMGQSMSTPFWSKDMAIVEANRLADSIRRHGEVTEVIVEDGLTVVSPTVASSRRRAASLPGRPRYVVRDMDQRLTSCA